MENFKALYEFVCNKNGTIRALQAAVIKIKSWIEFSKSSTFHGLVVNDLGKNFVSFRT